MTEIENPFVSIHNTLAFSPRDWSQNREDAWIYAIICGWGVALESVAARHGWSSEAKERLVRLRAEWLVRTGQKREAYDQG